MRKWFPASLIAGALVFSVAVYSRLPERVPVHWGFSGEPDRLGSRIEGAFLLPFAMIAVYVLMQWYPSRDPRAANIAKFRDAYDTVVAAIVAFLGGLHVIALGYALGWDIRMNTVVLAGIGVLFVLLGNLMPRMRSNFILGIRTPWTLSSEDVWTRSHRVGGYAMVAAGVVTLAAALMGGGLGLGIALGSLALAALFPIVYSYLLWCRGRRGPSDGQP
jgi:uncharacterized membrane protein